MIVSCIEELAVHNERRFTQLLKEKMGIVVDLLKLTVKGVVDEFKNVNF